MRVLLATATVALFLPVTAPAATAANPSPVGLTLTYQSPWVALRGAFSMLLHVDNPALAHRPGAAIAITVHQSISTRNDFDHVIATNEGGDNLFTLPPIPVTRLGSIAGNLGVTLGLSGSTEQYRVNIAHPGVYPLEVSLTNTGTASSSFITWLVVVDTSAPFSKPLMVSWIWQLVAPPATLPNGTTDPAIAAQMKRNGRLDRISTLLGRSARFPVSLVIGPETIETWSRLADNDPSLQAGLLRVRAAAQRKTTDLLLTPYVPIDQPALEAADLGDHYSEEVLKGASTLKTVLGAAPFSRPQTAFSDPTDNASVDRLRDLSISRVAVRDGSLIKVTHPFSPAQAFELATPKHQNSNTLGVATAPFVENLLNGPDPAALKAARVVAALAEVAYEFPTRARGLVIAPPADWTPDLSLMTMIVDAMRGLPLVQAVTLDDLFSNISTEKTADGVDVVRQLPVTTVAPGPLDEGDYLEARQRLAAYQAVVGPKDPLVTEGQRALLFALSTSLSPDRALAMLSQVDAGVQAFTSSVRVDVKRITLTAKKAVIPLTFENNLKPARRVSVRVHLESEKLLFPKGADEVVTLNPGSVTLRDFTVEARASGTFPLLITLTSQDGRLAFGNPVRVTVRSAVFGGFAIALSIAALVFLAGWWANHIWRTRRARRAAITS